MSQITGKNIAANSVGASDIRLANNVALRARNAADSADIDILKLNASNEAVIPSGSRLGANLIADQDYVQSQIGALPTPMQYKGVYNASTNSPALANTDTGKTGWLYQVNVAGSQDFGAGSISFEVGDKVVNNGTVWEKWDMTDAVTSVNSQSGAVVLDTDDIGEGSTNLYHTTSRARSAAVVNSTAGSETDQAASVSAMKSYVAGQIPAAPSYGKESKTLIAGDITAQYIDLLQVVKASSVDLVFNGVVQIEGEDYTVSLTGGAGGKTRITFAGDLATGGASELIAGDKIHFKYVY